MAIVNSKTKGEKVLEVVNVLVLCLLMLIFFYPIWYCLVASFSRPDLLTRSRGLLLWPLGYSLAGYNAVLNNQNITTGYLNTLLYVVMGVGFGMVLTCLGAYLCPKRI